MKKQIRFLTLAAALILAGTFPVMASGTKDSDEGHEQMMEESMEHSGHDMKEKMDHSAHDMEESMEHSGHDMKEKMEHSAHDMEEKAEHAGHDMKEEMDHEGHSDEKIHESHVDGYQLSYELIDMRERMKGMKNMPEMTSTHHLMVFIKGKDGKAIESGKVGYLIEGPGGRQKAMCMGMAGGYGADVKLGDAGSYTIKTKVASGDVRLMDSFEYVVK